MKLNIKTIKRIVKEEIEKGSAHAAFLQLIKKLQQVMRKHDVSGHGTYDPMGAFEGEDAWGHYGEQRDGLLADPQIDQIEHQMKQFAVRAAHTLGTKWLRVERLDYPEGEYEANTDFYIMLTGKSSIMVSDDYVYIPEDFEVRYI